MMHLFVFQDLPLAAVSCAPPSNIKSTSTEAVLDLSTIQVIDCGVTLNDVINATDVRDLNTIAVLTSRPESLSDEQISTATNTLASYLENSQHEVKCDFCEHNKVAENSDKYFALF